MFSAVTSALQSLWREITTDPSAPPSPSSTSSFPSSSPHSSHSPITLAFTPTPRDVQHARLLLVRGVGLPVELADLVIDAAQYWPGVFGTTTAVGAVPLRSGRGAREGMNAGGGGVVRASDTRRNKAAQLVVVTGAVPGDGEVGGEGRGWQGLRRVRLRKMRWWVKSRDQGWVSEGVGRRGTYSGSSSWFDACILRPLDPSTPRPPLAPEVAARIEAMMQRPRQPFSTANAPAETFPTFLVGNLLSHDPEDTREFLRSLGWDFVERVERVEVDGEIGERRGVLWKLQTNMVACREYCVHEGQWWRSGEVVDNEGLNEDMGGDMEVGSGDGVGFVDQLRAGDQVGIWARAMFPGWVNDVDEVKVEIRYSV